MARIPLTNGFVLIPEGTYIFQIYDAIYDEEFGKIKVKLVTAQGLTHEERFSIKNKDDELNEGALGAFSFFAKTALNDFSLEDIDVTDIINCYIGAEVVHTIMPSNKNPDKTVTFANLGDKFPADGFDTEPTARAMSLGRGDGEKAPAAPATRPAPKQQSVPAAQPGKLDLDALLG